MDKQGYRTVEHSDRFLTPPIKIKKLRESAVIPTAAKPGDACLDLVFAPQDNQGVWLQMGETRIFETGLAIELPVGYEALVRSRSGLATKGIFVLNAPGTIDEGYRGEIKVILHAVGQDGASFKFHPGDRIAQICFKPVYVPQFEEVTELSETQRGSGGLGSTGV